MRPALCGPHSCLHASPRRRSRLRLRLSGLLARAWARAVSVPTADFPYPAVRARAFPACPTACSPSRLSLLSRAARPVSLALTMMVAVVRTAARTALPNSRQPGFLPRRWRGRLLPFPCARLPILGLGCRHRRRQPVRVSRVASRRRFFSRFRGDPASSGPSEQKLTPKLKQWPKRIDKTNIFASRNEGSAVLR
jgi:hypothetical protein